MNKKDFQLLINNIAEKLKPINQLLFECLCIIVFYNLFNVISFKNTNINSHKSFIYLVGIICVILDWFIWNNHLQTTLFIAILIIYITYNINIHNEISTFINIVNNIKKENIIKADIQLKELNVQRDFDLQNMKNSDNLDMITFIPTDIDIKNSIEKNRVLDPYEKNVNERNVGNELNLAYAANIPEMRITDSKYAEIKLNDLYGSPQYKNIEDNEIDETLSNDINQSTQETKDEQNINLFKNPTKVFLDDRWLSKTENTYNDNCKGCVDNGNGKNYNLGTKTRSKNAICSVVKYGQQLEECVNNLPQVSSDSLKKISGNKIEPIYKF